MKSFYRSIFASFIVSILVLCSCTTDSTGKTSLSDAETPKDLVLGNLEHDHTTDMVYVEGGAFQMGNTTKHWVTVNNFYIGKYEITQAEYEAIMKNNPSNFIGKHRPVENVTWFDAVEYCNKLSKTEHLIPCYSGSGDSVTCNWNANGYRLPTEAEWEYAAKGGMHQSPYQYSGSDNIDEVAWYNGNSGNQTHEVGTKAPNVLGIYDMNGNVCEWCWDWYGKYNSSAKMSPVGPASGSFRILRGGGWNFNETNCWHRHFYKPTSKSYNLGFRVVRSVIATNMVYVEGGTFKMGSIGGDRDEEPIHEVTVSSFYIGKYEVTQAKYEAIMRNNPSCFRGEHRPVENVTWYNAVEYCNKLSETEHLTPCYSGSGNSVTCNWNANGYRLPTEAEWEYAAKGGIHQHPYCPNKYSGSDNIDEVAWYHGDCFIPGSTHPDYGTHKVGTKKANELGIYDMSGNVFEWCWDWYNCSYYSSSTKENPVGPASGSKRVLRGGSWCNAFPCRCTYRHSYDPNWKLYSWGFRVVRSCK